MDFDNRNEIRRLISEQLGRDENLSSYGLGWYEETGRSLEDRKKKHERYREELTDSVYVEQVRHCLLVLREIGKRKTINTSGGSSYAYKHIVENIHLPESSAKYICNGAFITAARIMGFKDNGYHPNPCFNMSSKSWSKFED